MRVTPDREPARTCAIEGLMMDVPLTTRLLLDRMTTVNSGSRIVTLKEPDGLTCEVTRFAQMAARARQVAAGLEALGVRAGDRVASLAFNTREHLELYFGVTAMGAVLHTINLRLHADQLAWTVNHAQDRVVVVQASLLDQLLEVLPRLEHVEHVVVIADETGDGAGHLDYESMLRDDVEYTWPDLDERSAASLCYTSGTTGDPKGVLYSHRGIVLHALAMSGADVYGLRRADVALTLVPLFHAMAWGMPFVSALVGNDMVLPGRHVRPDVIAGLIEQERVTWSSGVPTLWSDLLQCVDEATSSGTVVDLGSLERVLCGGTAVPERLMREYDRRFGVEIFQGWGMTEIFPGATVGPDEPQLPEDERWSRRRAAGRLSPLYEVRILDGEDVLPADGASVGEIEVRGPTVSGAYYGSPPGSDDRFHEGWLRTGDIGTLDPAGWLRITDRSKDAIKSGGEWISSVDLESAICDHPLVREAAVIGVPDDRWGERPHAYVVAAGPLDHDELASFLRERVARWWLPDEVHLVSSLPRTSTGKLDKRSIRAATSA